MVTQADPADVDHPALPAAALVLVVIGVTDVAAIRRAAVQHLLENIMYFIPCEGC